MGRGSIGFAPNRQQTWSSKLIYHPLHPHQQHQHHKEHHLQWQSGKIVFHLPIIGILGYFWDAHMQLGSIPTSCHPKPRLSTPQDLVEFTFILCQKEESSKWKKSENIITYL